MVQLMRAKPTEPEPLVTPLGDMKIPEPEDSIIIFIS